jgi:hypothetical protein
VILLVSKSHPEITEHAHPSLGRLVQPRHYSSIRRTAAAGIPWAADNDAYVRFDERRFGVLLDALEGLGGCLFCAAPDAVTDTPKTLRLFDEWASVIQRRGLPVALVLQDGMTTASIPWRTLDAVFIGGTTTYKLGADAARIIQHARARGLWCHMGRVNSAQRIRYAASIGCHSVDGTSYARWRDVHLRAGILAAHHAREPQLRLTT